MKLSVLKSFLEQEISYSLLKKKIEQEVLTYSKQVNKKGASAPVLVEDDAEIKVTTFHLHILCDAYLNKEIENIEMYYIADTLLIAEHNFEGKNVSFADEDLKEKFQSLTDPEINFGELTPDIVKSILMY